MVWNSAQIMMTSIFGEKFVLWDILSVVEVLNSNTRFSLVGPTKVKAHKSFLRRTDFEISVLRPVFHR